LARRGVRKRPNGILSRIPRDGIFPRSLEKESRPSVREKEKEKQKQKEKKKAKNVKNAHPVLAFDSHSHIL
jgi:hypothetical protein